MKWIDVAIRVAMVVTLLWIGYELHGIHRDVYAGPSTDDAAVIALDDIADKLEEIRRLLISK